VDVAEVGLRDAARELALVVDLAEEHLRRGRDALTESLGPDYVERLHSLAGPVSAARLPRPSVVLRAGRERRRLTTVTAVAGAVAVTIGMGAVAREPGIDRAAVA